MGLTCLVFGVIICADSTPDTFQPPVYRGHYCILSPSGLMPPLQILLVLPLNGLWENFRGHLRPICQMNPAGVPLPQAQGMETLEDCAWILGTRVSFILRFFSLSGTLLWTHHTPGSFGGWAKAKGPLSGVHGDSSTLHFLSDSPLSQFKMYPPGEQGRVCNSEYILPGLVS